MKKFTHLSVVISALISMSSAVAANNDSNMTKASDYCDNKENSGYYIGARLGISLPRFKETPSTIQDKDKNKNAPTAGFGLGYNFYNEFALPLRAEFDYTFRKAVDTKDRKSSVFTENRGRLQTAMLNAYYDIYTDSDFTPYIGAGLGYANIKLEHKLNQDSYSNSDNKFAWTLGTGVGYKVNNHIDLQLGYQYLQTGAVKYSPFKVKASTHDISAGVNYYF